MAYDPPQGAGCDLRFPTRTVHFVDRRSTERSSLSSQKTARASCGERHRNETCSRTLAKLTITAGGRDPWTDSVYGLRVTYDACSKDKREALGDWVAIMRQLRVVGDDRLGDVTDEGERAPFSQKGWDVKAPDGELIQVKFRRKTPDSNPTVLSPISHDEYDSLVVVLFDEDFQVTEGLKAGRALVEERFELDSKNQRRVTLSRLRADPEVEKVDFSAVSAWLSPVIE